MNHGHSPRIAISKPSRQVLRRAAIRARRMQRSVQRAMERRGLRVAMSPLALIAGWLIAGSPAHANPAGGQVVAGSATIESGAPGVLNIFQQSSRAVIDWRSFSIATGETVNFLQPSSSSATLNRVLGNDPSAIFGRLNANGTVMLVNPNGIVFGAGSRVDVGGLVASTANIANTDFMAGRHLFGVAGSPTAGIENHGLISIRDSGLAALVAPRVRNAGVIEARLGRVVLGAANTFTLDFHGDGLLSFSAGSAVTEAAGNAALVSNTGEIRADGGTVLLTARAVKGVVDQVINTDGLVSATTVSGHEGRIVLSGGDAGTVAIGGSVDASAKAGGQGGTVVATGEHVSVASGARVDASGLHGGGEIALGSTGLTDAAQPFAHKSQSVSIASGATLSADATAQGDGGTITAWSKEQTVFAGSLSARGGAEGGDGGFAEISSQKNIGLTGSVDLRAPKGQTGTLLLDPTDLRITDAASGGGQDGNAGDGVVNSGDANAALNTVSRGLLESMAGNANIVLQATGQITVDAMASGRIDLQTTSGNSFTLQSTQSGGIRFADANTEIRTQGGGITLEALGIGSTLSNIGRLTTNGGDVTLRATGDIQLAGNINAGSGAVSAQSTVGSIANASGATPLVTGNSVTLTAGGGHIGAAGSAIGTHTAQLSLEAGGSIHAGSDMALTDLSVTALHVAPGTNTYGVTGSGLTFQLSSDGSTATATQITQSGLNLALSSDRSLELGTVNLGAGTLSAGSTGGNLTGAAGNAVTASAVTLSAQGSSGTSGAIGTGSQSINTTTSTLSATSGSGGAFVANTGAMSLNTLSTTGSSNISSTGTLTAGNVNVGSATLTLGSSTGNVVDDGNSSTRITAGTLSVNAGGNVGSGGTRLATTAGTVSANAGGGVYLGTSATASVLSSITAGNGAIDITTGGSTTLTSLSSSTSAPANSITVAATGTGSMSVGTVNAGVLGDVTLTSTSGSISGNTGLITGDTVTLHAGTAGSGAVSVRTAASHLDVQAGSSSISITQTGSVTLDRISTPSTFASVTSSSGDITVGSVSTSTSGQVTLTASAGAILDDGDTSTRITTGTASLNASGAIGAPGAAVQTQATGLTASSTGDLVVANTGATLTSLNLTNRHTAPGNAATIQVDSPYLTFDVTDTGNSYELTRLVGVPLGSLSFNGDTSITIGQVQAAGSVSLTSTQGSLVDDGNSNTRITSGSTLTLSAAQGSLGSLANPLGLNTSALAATTRGDLYVGSLTDLSTLTINSSHPDTTTSFGMGITAPSLRMAVTDSAAGHNVATLTDTSGLTLNFTSDRDITLGNVNLTNTGTVRFTSTGGRILDDGNKATTVLGNSTTLSGSSVGESGANHMDVVTGTLAATASAGGVYVEVPMPTGSTNTTSTVTLGTITATGPVQITALEGDLSLGGFLTATNQAVNLTATSGSILSPIGYSIGLGAGALTLTAGQAIGTSSRAIPVTSSGGSITATAGTNLFVSSSGATTLSNLSASTGITYAQSSGTTTAGTVDAGGSTVAITNSSGSIADDGNAGTVITGNQVNLSAAAGSVGAPGAAMNVAAPQLSVTANGNVAVDDSATLTSLGLTRGAGSSGTLTITSGGGQTFNLSEDGTAHHLTQVTSATPLAFSFSGQRDISVGDIDVGAAGSATLTTSTSIANSGGGSSIAAGTVSLTAGSTGSIGSSGDAIALEGTTGLTLSAGRNFHVSSDAALANLTLTSTNTTTAAVTASVFGVNGLGQTFNITDSGTTQSLDFSGTALGNFSFTTRKNIQVGAITATGDVTLSTSGGGANSNISSDSGTGTIAGNRVLLTATSSTAGGGSIGSSGTALRVDTPTLVLNGSANMYVADAQNLTGLDMTVTHGTNTTFGYGITAGNLNSFAIADGNTQSLGLAVSGAMDFAYSTDRALSLATIDAGTSSTGSISLTSRSAPTGTGAQINRSSGTLTGGRITLSATGSNGGVGAGATLSTNTQNLSIASGGNVSVSNSTTLSSLSLDARHNTSGSSTHSYAISSTGLTFSVSDTLGNNAFQLANISQSGLALSVAADRVITASNVNTGAGGSVTLRSGSYIQGGSGASAGSPSITTGTLTLNGGSAFGYQGGTPLYTSAGTLNSGLSNTLYLSNNGNLTLGTNTVGSSADVATSSGSLLQGSGGLFTAPTLRLSANQSIGGTGTVLTDARRLTLVSRGNIDVGNASDLYALSITSTHGTPGAQNTIAVTAPELTLALTDSVGGNQYHLSNLVDDSGLDFTLSTDVALNLGTVDAKAGRSLGLYSTGTNTSITNDGGSLLTASNVTLSATGSVGSAGGSGTRMQTDALGVTVSTGANAYLDNAQDLSSLSLTSTQSTGGSAPTYEFTAPALSFNVTDNGTTHVNSVTDTTGLNFSLNTQRSQAIGSINLGVSGTVSLTSHGDIHGDASSANRITAGSFTGTTTNGGDLGSLANPLRLSTPLVTLNPTGAMNVESDTHIDRLSISVTHPTVTYGGNYSILSVPISGAQATLFSATDSVTGTALTSLTDTEGLAFSFTSDGAMQVGTLNLGTTGTVSLTGIGSGGIVGDGDANTQVQAASLSMTNYGGAIGAAGSGNAIDATVNSLSATAQGGGVTLALHGRTLLGSISATGGVSLANDVGDIALGSINAGGNAVTIDNQGGSILSGSIYNATTVGLTAAGSIGNQSAIGTSANGGGTTTLTASASAANGAAGSIAISESYSLYASSVIAPAAINLSSGYGLLVGTVNGGAAVSLDSSQGSINGISGNSITGTSVTASARYGTGNGIGNSAERLNVNTSQLTLNTPGSVYITDTADLNRLTIDRTNYASTGSAGTLSVIASNLTLSATDAGNTTTFTNLTDSTGLDFTYLGMGSLAIGTMDVGSNGSATLQAYLSGGNGNITAINGSSLLTAGSATLQAYGTGSTIGTSGTRLGTAIGSLTASSGTGGIYLQQAGSLNLSSINTTGNLNVLASAGDLTLGTLSYGSSSALNLNASAGSILSSGTTLSAGSSAASMTLSAANGIGTGASPLSINGNAGQTVSASVTGNGSLHLNSTGTMNGGLTTSVNNGSTNVTAAGNIRLASMTTGTDAEGNDIRVTASAGDITVVNVSGGANAQHTGVELTASAGSILAASGAMLEAYDVSLYGATGVGTATDRVAANGQRVQVESGGGAIYLNATAPSVLSNVSSNGGLINIATAADLHLANASSHGGTIVVNALGGNIDLVAGNIDAGAGTVHLASTGAGGTIQDDGISATRITGATVTLTAAAGVGTPSNAVQTSAGILNLSNDVGAAGLYVNDANTSGVTLGTVVASGGAIVLNTAGPTTANIVTAASDAAGNNVTITTSSGDLTVEHVSAGANNGTVTLNSAGSILGSGGGTHVSGAAAQLTAAGDIGAVTDLATGAGTPLRINVGTLGTLTSTGSNRVVSIDNLNTALWTLSGGSLSLGSGSSAYLRAAGDLTVGSTPVVDGNLMLSSAGVLTLPASGLSANGALHLTGSTDVVAEGGTPRTLTLAGDSVTLRSGAAGGATTLATTTDTLDAALSGAGALTVNNAGNLTSTTLQTSNGNISATSSTGLTATSVTAGGTGRTVSLTATTGDLMAGTVNAGSGGTVNLTATAGSVLGASPAITASLLNLSAGSGIGSSGTAFDATGTTVSAEVTGTGSIYLGASGALGTAALSTANGDIMVNSTGNLNLNGAVNAGGNASFASSGGQIVLTNGGVTSSGTQSYASPVLLGAATTLNGGAVSFAGTVDGSHALTVNSAGATSFGGVVNTASVTTDAAGTLAINGGAVTTTGAQNYGEQAVLGTSTTLTGSSVTLNAGADGTGGVGRDLSIAGAGTLAGNVSTSGTQAYNGAVTLAGDTTLSGGAVSLNSTVDGNHALTVNSAGATSFGGVVRTASVTTDAAGTLAINGGAVETTGAQNYGEQAVLGASTSLTGSSVTLNAGADGTGGAGRDLTIAGAGTLAGNVSTSGTQAYNGAVTLAGDTTLSGSAVALNSTVDGNHALVVNSAGATRFGGVVRTASVTTDAAGTLAINGGAVETTGTQHYGEIAVLGASTTLTGSNVTLNAGADATGGAGRELVIVGAAVLGHDVTTSGDQVYNGAVTIAGTTLQSTGGSLTFNSTLDNSANGNLTLRADAGSISVVGDVGTGGLLGVLTLHSGTFTTFNGSVLAGSVAQTGAGGLTRFGGSLTASAAGGLQLNGASFQFDGPVTASLGGIDIANTDSTGTVNFAAGAAIQANTGFTQAGGAGVVLPASLTVANGGVSIGATASLPSGQASIVALGDITMTGLQGAATNLTLNPGANGRLRIGLSDADANHKLHVATLAVPRALSADLYGTLGGQGGAMAASRVNSSLVNAPYFFNDTPWGPVGTIATVTATTAPRSVVPSRPGAQTLFSRSYSLEGAAPNVLEVMLDPQVLTLSPETQQNRRKPLLETQ